MQPPELDNPTLDTVLPLARQLTLLDKVRLIENLLPDIKGSLAAEEQHRQEVVKSAMMASESAFARLWDNEEDAAYDQL
jgi:hypothetical protein